jgi:polysaccharide deacetylase family sporulation protein PdaB
MILLIKKRNFHLLFMGILLFSVSIGTYNLALHPHMREWKQQKLVITDVKTSQKVVALTFDDGPDSTNTPALLDILKKHHVKATFFVIGTRAEKNPKILKQIAKDGHEIGNHGYTHFKDRSRKEDYMRYEIRKTNEVINELTGQTPCLFRPPGGYLSDALVALTQKEKIQIAYWSYIQDSKDWRGASAQAISKHIIKHIKPGQIIILHDGASNGLQTAKAVDILVDKLSQQGYSFVTVSELMKLGNKE